MKKNTIDQNNYNNMIAGLKLDPTQKSVLTSTWLDYLLLMNKSAEKG